MKGSFLPDSNCLVAAILGWHEHHDATAHEIETRLRRGERMVIAAHALAEAYAVLTRLPAPHRISGEDALTLLRENFFSGTRVVALEASGYLSVLEEAPAFGVAGGRTYDAVIARCAREAGVTALLTFDDSHFRGLLPDGIEIVVPGKRA